MYIRKRK